MCPRPVRIEASSFRQKRGIIFLTKNWQLYDNELCLFLLCMDSCSYAMIGKRGGCNTCLTWPPCTLEPFFFWQPGRRMSRRICAQHAMFTHRMHILIYTGAHLYIYLYENVHTHRDMPGKKLCRTWRMQVSAHTHVSLRMCAFFRVRAEGYPVSNPKQYRCVYVYQRTRAARAARAHTRRTAACARICEAVLAGTGDDEVWHAD